MKGTTKTAKAMTDAMLDATATTLRRRIPEDQALLSAVIKEQRRRKKKARAGTPDQAAESAGRPSP